MALASLVSVCVIVSAVVATMVAAVAVLMPMGSSGSYIVRGCSDVAGGGGEGNVELRAVLAAELSAAMAVAMVVAASMAFRLFTAVAT